MTLSEYAKGHSLDETIAWAQDEANGVSFNIRINLKKIAAIWKEAQNAASEPEAEAPRAKVASPITLRFYAEDGKAVARYSDGEKDCKAEIKSREHAVALARRAVENANEQGRAIRFEHGFEEESEDPFRPTLRGACLSVPAYEAVWAELRKAKENELFRLSL